MHCARFYRAFSDAVRGVAVNKFIGKPRRAGSVYDAGICGVGSVMFARYRFCAVRCFGGGGYGGIAVVPDVRGWVYGGFAGGGVRIVMGAGSGFLSRFGTGYGSFPFSPVVPVHRVYGDFTCCCVRGVEFAYS